jgi:large subunit ribosomal protein L25
MKTFELQGQIRAKVGAITAKTSRTAGQIPAVLYHGQTEPVHFTVSNLELEKLLHSADTHLVHLNIDGNTHKAVLRETQFHPVSDAPMHADFYGVSEANPVVVSLPINFLGNSKGVLAGGTLVKKLRKLKVKGLLSKLPERVNVDISELELGKTIKVKDLNFEGIQIITPASAAVVTIDIPRSLRGDKAAEAAPAKK